MTADRVTQRVSLHQFHKEGVQSDSQALTFWVGEMQAEEVTAFVADLMEAHKDNVE